MSTHEQKLTELSEAVLAAEDGWEARVQSSGAGFVVRKGVMISQSGEVYLFETGLKLPIKAGVAKDKYKRILERLEADLVAKFHSQWGLDG